MTCDKCYYCVCSEDFAVCSASKWEDCDVAKTHCPKEKEDREDE